jgi:peptidoglycan/LPS O-acetylase OafA/YrhL
VDVSYGLYLYAFPVQQTLVAFGLHKRGVVYYFGLAMVIATTMAVVSYFAIERPALSLKHLRLPARPPKPAG